MGEKMADSILRTTCDFHGKCTDLLHASKLRHGTDGFTSPPREGMLWIFTSLQPGLNPRTRVPEASMLTTRPLKPLNSSFIFSATGYNTRQITDRQSTNSQLSRKLQLDLGN
jgi:hypothetical protein